MPARRGRERRERKATRSPVRKEKEKEERLADEIDRDELSDDFTVFTGASEGTFGTLMGDEFNDDGSEENEEEEGGASADAGGSNTEQRHYKMLMDAINAASELPSERRASKRETILKRLFKALSQYSTPPACSDALEANLDDSIIPACLFGVTKGTSPAEQYAACRCLEALAVSLGFGRDDYCELVEEPLRRSVMATGKAHVVRSAALRAMCLSNFICSTDESATESLLSLCEKVGNERWRGEDNHPLLRATGLDCWALLSTTVSDAHLAGGDDGRGVAILPLLQNCLEGSSADLRVSAGGCVTLIHEARLELGVGKEEVANSTERRFRHGSWDGSEVEVLMDELRQRMAELSVESGHRMSKKAKKEQRSVFREFVSTVVEDEPPSEVVSFRGGSLTLSTWREIIQLDFIRRCLQGGFQIQLMANPTLLYIFDADGAVLQDANASSMSQLEKRLVMSKNSSEAKSADIDLTRRRRTRTKAKNYFITVDGEDI